MIEVRVSQASRELTRNHLVDMIESSPVKCNKYNLCNVDGKKCRNDNYKDCKVYKFFEKYGNKYREIQ